MTSKKKNPQLCTTVASLTKGTSSIFRVSGLFNGKARLCRILYYDSGKFNAVTIAGNRNARLFHLKDVESGKINIMCIERGV